jgi:hypothetical protein
MRLPGDSTFVFIAIVYDKATSELLWRSSANVKFLSEPEFLENCRNKHDDTLAPTRTIWIGQTWNSLKTATSPPLGSALQSIIEWIIQGADFTKLDADAHVGRRAIALFWTLNPDYFEGVSLTTLANRLGLHKAILSAQAAEARRKFGIKNRGQGPRLEFRQGRTETNGDPQGRSIGRGRNVAGQGSARSNAVKALTMHLPIPI